MTTPPQSWFPLRTERLLLRDFQLDDFEAVHAYGSDPEVARYMEWGPNTPDDTRAFLTRALASQAIWPRLDFGLAIESRSLGMVIGSIRLHLRDGRTGPPRSATACAATTGARASHMKRHAPCWRSPSRPLACTA